MLHPKPKKPKARAAEKTAPPSNLPAPQRVPKASVGRIVQDFISFGDATAVEVHQEDGDTWLVTATA